MVCLCDDGLKATWRYIQTMAVYKYCYRKSEAFPDRLIALASYEEIICRNSHLRQEYQARSIYKISTLLDEVGNSLV